MQLQLAPGIEGRSGGGAALAEEAVWLVRYCRIWVRRIGVA